MNNDQFRRLVSASTGASSPNGSNATSPGGAKPAVAAALGSRLKSSIPMTPRSLGVNTQNLFAKQLAERDQAAHPQKRLRTSAPKGSKLAQGYVDRARIRQEQEEAEARAAKLRALEQSFDRGEIDEDTYKSRRAEVGDAALPSNVPSKGLDFELLAKARNGETEPDEESPGDGSREDAAEDADANVDVDDALEQLEGAEVQAVAREKTQKKGQLTTKAVGPGGRRTRDQLLAELKASREAAKAKEQSALGTKFKKIGAQKTPGTRIERDSKGREVMIIVDEDGHEKRKVRKIVMDEAPTETPTLVPEKKAEVLGMEVPEYYRKKQEELEAKKQEEEDDDDIFADAGEYNPLAGMDSDSDDDSSEEEGEAVSDERDSKKRGIEDISGDGTNADNNAPGSASTPKRPEPPAAAPKNYFLHSKTGLVSEESRKITAANDPAVLAALRKAKALNAEAKSEEEKEVAEREARLKKMLQDSNRDTEDLDMGFGTNRLEDEADMEERDIKLSAWGDEGDEGQGGSGKAKRKRGGKKRKGDVNSATDVLQVLERRKAAES